MVWHLSLFSKFVQSSTILLLFDEGLNQINQKKQMDMIVRFWDSKSKRVTVRYFNSEFMSHATAADMLIHFKHGMALLNPISLVQISIGGPNVNWKFDHNFFQERKGKELPDLLNIACCSFQF